MNNSFESLIQEIGKNQQSLKWTTDKGVVVHGVLLVKEGRVYLNVNPDSLDESVNFEYLYHEDIFGGRRVLYPYDIASSKFIPAGGGSETWPIEIFLCEDVANSVQGEAKCVASFEYDSFLWFKVPETKRDIRKYINKILKIHNIDTSVGQISVSLLEETSGSNRPSKSVKSMDKIIITFEKAEVFTNSELLMWSARFSQLLTLINKEHVPTRAINRGYNNILITSLMEDFKPASYAFRSPIGLEAFVKIIKRCLPNFVERYDEFINFTEDLVTYYRDYPLNPPDKIQLLRLFTSLEQCAVYAQKQEGILLRQLTNEEKVREGIYTEFMKPIKKDKKFSLSLKQYLLESKNFYISSGSQSIPKYKIVGLAKLLQRKYDIYLCLTHIERVELIIKMRNVVAHGLYRPEVEAEFYQMRDELGEDIEMCLRMYILKTLGAKPSDVKFFSEPLKAHKFNTI